MVSTEKYTENSAYYTLKHSPSGGKRENAVTLSRNSQVAQNNLAVKK